MTPSCPHCGSGNCTRNGYGSNEAAYLDGGRVAYRPARTVRVVCRDCGRSGSLRDEADMLGEAALREHLAERTFALGQEAAAREVGMPSTTLQGYLQAWAGRREPDVEDAAPDHLLLASAHLRREDCLLAVDMERRTLVEILRGEKALRAWLDHPSRAPALRACIPLDPRLASVLREHVPSTVQMVSPPAVRLAVGRAADNALRALRRLPGMASRNGMPTPAEFAEALDGRLAPHEGWPSEARVLLSAATVALAVSAAGGREEGERLWPEMALAAAERPARAVRDLMETWREPLLEGLGRPEVEAVEAMAARIGTGLASRKPTLGLQDLRSFALLRDFERAPGVRLHPGHRPATVAVGTSLEILAERIAA